MKIGYRYAQGRQFWRCVKTVAPLALAAVFLFLLSERLQGVDVFAVWHLAETVTPQNWVLAGLATALSFWAVGRYDAIIHRHIGTSVGTNSAQRSGMAAIAVAQTLGFGVFTGAVARWRMLPELSLWAATKVSAMVALTFFAGLGVVLSLVFAVLPLPAALSGGTGLQNIALPLAVLCLGLVTVFPRFSVLGKTIHLPPVRALLSVTALTALDTFAACAALWVLLPTGTELPFLTLLPVFLLALSAGLLTGTPGGVGPFELVFLSLLATHDTAGLVAAICAFRLVYYAIPAVLGALAILLRPCQSKPSVRVLLEPYRRPLDGLLARAPAEYGILRQGDARLLSGPFQSVQIVHETGQALVAVGPALCGTEAATLTSLKQAANAHNLAPCLYKCSPRQALAARQAGWHVLKIAEEAVVRPDRFDCSASSARYLRRKLRKADKAGLRITAAGPHLPLAQMAEVSALWSERQGGERGFSMGRFAADYVAHQQVFLAHQGDRLVGFVTFHHAQTDWCLDLIRFRPDAPDGIIYSLLKAAIDAAATARVETLSLAAAPLSPSGPWGVRKLRAWFEKLSGGPGLRHFKSAFSPDWQPRYICAPTGFDLALTAVDIARAIHAPDLVTPSASPTHWSDESPVHDHYDEYGLVPLPRA